jgi:hypothetical protein
MKMIIKDSKGLLNAKVESYEVQDNLPDCPDIDYVHLDFEADVSNLQMELTVHSPSNYYTNIHNLVPDWNPHWGGDVSVYKLRSTLSKEYIEIIKDSLEQEN